MTLLKLLNNFLTWCGDRQYVPLPKVDQLNLETLKPHLTSYASSDYLDLTHLRVFTGGEVRVQKLNETDPVFNRIDEVFKRSKLIPVLTQALDDITHALVTNGIPDIIADYATSPKFRR